MPDDVVDQLKSESKPSHICLAANTTWYVHNFRRRLIVELIERGHDVTVLSPPDEYISSIVALGVQHIPLPMRNAGTNPFVELATLLRIASRLRRIRPAVLLTFTPKMNIYVAMVARALRIPVIANVSGLGRAFTYGGWLQRIVRRMYRIAFKEAHLVFFQNEDDRTEFVAGDIVGASRAQRLPGSGVDIDRFCPVNIEKERAEFVFLLVARLLREKGVVEYVEAARNIRVTNPGVSFRIVGFLDDDNPSAISRKEMEAWVREGSIEYLGPVKDVRSSYAAADCIVLPSYYREGVPRTLLEAASMGKPVITTNAVGCRDAVDDGVSGFLCRPRDADDLAKMMRRILSLPEDARRKMGVAGREKMIREFDERGVIARYQMAVNAIVGPKTSISPAG